MFDIIISFLNLKIINEIVSIPVQYNEGTKKRGKRVSLTYNNNEIGTLI